MYRIRPSLSKIDDERGKDRLLGFPVPLVVVVAAMAAGCLAAVPPPEVAVVTLGPSTNPAVPPESVEFVQQAPNCPAVAQLTIQVLSDGSQRALRALRTRAAELGANTLVVSTEAVGPNLNNGITLQTIQHTAMALRCG